jgi:hypothetical protein
VVNPEVPPEEVSQRDSAILPRAEYANLRESGPRFRGRAERQWVDGQLAAQTLNLFRGHATEALDHLGADGGSLTDAAGELSIGVPLGAGDLEVEAAGHRERQAEDE